MSSEAVVADRDRQGDRPVPSLRRLLMDDGILIAGLLALVIPTLLSLARTIWTTEAGVHGPIVLATGIWLILRQGPRIRAVARPGHWAATFALLVPSLAVYVFGRAYDFISLEVAGLLGALVAAFYSRFGLAAVRLMWFPIVYLGFLAPIPGWLIDLVTGPLKAALSEWSIALLSAIGYPVAREGVTIYVAQYQLLVADACAGLNSLVSLTAISLFYIYLLHQASWRYALFLVLWIVPLAILANLIRIVILVLVTYYLGDAAAQGFLHSTAGLVMFATALLGVFVIDRLMTATVAMWKARR